MKKVRMIRFLAAILLALMVVAMLLPMVINIFVR